MLVSILRETLLGPLLDEGLVALDQFLQIVSGEVVVRLSLELLLELVHDFIERLVVVFALRLNTHDNVSVHLDEAAVAIPCETLVARLLGQGDDSSVIQAKIQNCVHHARHRLACTGANGEEERVGLAAKLLALFLFDLLDGSLYFGFESLGVIALVLTEVGTNFRGDSESGRHRQPDGGHLSKVRTLTSEEILHLCVSVGLLTERVYGLDGLGSGFALRGSLLGFLFAGFSWHGCYLIRVVY